MKIAITGGTGFIGKWVLETIGKKMNVTVLGRDKVCKNVAIGMNDFKYVYTDYSELDLLDKLNGYDALIHLAAARSGSLGFKPYLDNIGISQSLFEACKQNKISNIVCLSSIAVYSDINRTPWKENDYVMPLSFYGISKASMENIAEYYNRTKSMNIKCLRVAQVVGYGERTGFMLMNFIKQAFNKEILNVYGEGAGKREYIYVKDVADAILHALSREKTLGIFNIGTGVNTSHYELAKIINLVFNNEGNLEFVKNIREDKTIFLMDGQKTKEELGWTSKWTLEEGLKDIRDLMIQKRNEGR